MYSNIYSIEPHFSNSKKMLPIAMLLGWICLPMGRCQADEQFQILKSKPSVVFQRVGTLYPTINFAHIRVSANLTELQSVSVEICQSAHLFTKLSNYTNAEVLDNINPSISEAFRSEEDGSRFPSESFSSIMRSMVNGLKSKCRESEVSMGLVQQIFRSVPISSSTLDTIHERETTSLGYYIIIIFHLQSG